MAIILSACGSTDGDTGIITPVAIEPQAAVNEPIAQFLKASAMDGLQLNDGLTPITNGDWARFDVNTTWNWQLRDEINTSYEADVYVLDMFEELTRKSIQPLHNLGRKVVCYFSAGTYEWWRPDAELFAAFELGEAHVSFPDERWLNINNPAIAKLMVNRMDMAVALGCDGVELDNVDGFSNITGFNISQQDGLNYTRILANEAHKRGLSVALKNNVEFVKDVVNYFDLLINEECFEWRECEGYFPMIEAGKPVFNAEYKLFDAEHVEHNIDNDVEREKFCNLSRSYGFQSLILPLALDGSFRYSCQ